MQAPPQFEHHIYRLENRTGTPVPKFGYLRRHKHSIPWIEGDRDFVNWSWPVAIAMLNESVQLMARIKANGSDGWEQAWNSTPAKRWFGTWNKARMKRVDRYLRRALRKMKRNWIIFLRVDRDDFVAEASRGSRSIYLFNRFFRPGDMWSCPDPPPDNVTYTSTLRNAGSIVHEVIHTVGLTIGGDTLIPRRKEKYGKSALQLARDTPRLATRNADNYALFAIDVHINTGYRSKSDRWRKCLKAVILKAESSL